MFVRFLFYQSEREKKIVRGGFITTFYELSLFPI